MSTSDAVKIALEGRITAYTAAALWRGARGFDRTKRGTDNPVDTSRLEYVDSVSQVGWR
jgi:hypothetical protein